MNYLNYQAYIVEEKEGEFVGSVQNLPMSRLPEGDLLIRVSYSCLNYKDVLSAAGNRGVTKKFPHTPGIDAVGRVVEAPTHSEFSVGDMVVVTGFDLGMNTAGGLGQFIRVPQEWALHLPSNLSARESMIYGTAGLTAALSVHKLTRDVTPQNGPIAVSGATGGVGSLALSILSKLGYDTIAISGKHLDSQFLTKIGANAIISRHDFDAPNTKPLLRSYLGGAIDTVGGTILDNLIKLTQPEGVVTCCGNAASAELDLTVYPFILRGISLLGIDSQNCPIPLRKQMWQNLAGDWKPNHLAEVSKEITLHQLPRAMAEMRAGMSYGRTIVNLDV